MQLNHEKLYLFILTLWKAMVNLLKKNKAQFYHIARGSATECAAILNAAKIMKILNSK